jgi:hypothetical protein
VPSASLGCHILSDGGGGCITVPAPPDRLVSVLLDPDRRPCPSGTSRFRPLDFDDPSVRRLPPPHRGSFLLRLPGTSERCSIGCPHAVDPRVPSSGVVEDESELSAPDVDVEDQRPLLTPDPLSLLPEPEDQVVDGVGGEHQAHHHHDTDQTPRCPRQHSCGHYIPKGRRRRAPVRSALLADS